MKTSEGSESKSQPDYTSLRILAALSTAEVAILYLLIAVETPAAPIVRGLLDTRAGLVIVVASVVSLLLLAMAGVLLLRRRHDPVTQSEEEGDERENRSARSH